jgi:hypothetical protein
VKGGRLQLGAATPERQQPTTNERLLAARARVPHEAESAATPEKQQPTTNERLLAARARAPHEAERQRGAHQ